MHATICTAVNLCALLTVYQWRFVEITTQDWCGRIEALELIEAWIAGQAEDMPHHVSQLPNSGKVSQLLARLRADDARPYCEATEPAAGPSRRPRKRSTAMASSTASDTAPAPGLRLIEGGRS